MSIIQFDRINILTVSNPVAGSILIAYDLDGILKQKDENGLITIIGGTVNTLSEVLQVGNDTGNEPIILGTGSYIATSENNSKLTMNWLDTNDISLSTDEFHTESFVHLSSLTASLGFNNSGVIVATSSIINELNSNNKSTLSTSGYDLNLGGLNVISVGVSQSQVVGNRLPTMISSVNSKIDNSVSNTVVLAMSGIVATQSNSVYINRLIIQDNETIRSISGIGEIKINSNGDLLNSNDTGVIAIFGTQSNEVLNKNGILIYNSYTQSSSPNIDSEPIFIGTKASIGSQNIKNTVIIGGGSMIATMSDVVYLGNKVSIDGDYILPVGDGLPNQIIKTDGLGTLTWTTLASNNLSSVLTAGNTTGALPIIIQTQSYISGANGYRIDFYNNGDKLVLSSDNGVLSADYIKIENGLQFKGATISITTDNNKGMIYSADYNSSFVTHSLIDKLYVDTLVNAIQQDYITGVTAGLGLTGGGASGYVTLDINLDSSALEINNDNVSLKSSISGDRTFSDSVIISGNLSVLGTSSTIYTEDLYIRDNIITLNATWSGSPVLDSGLIINRGSSQSASLTFNETIDYWQLGLSGSESTIITESGNGLTKTNNSLQVNYTDVSVGLEGSGLTASAGKINIGAGNGITVNSDSIQVNYTDVSVGLEGSGLTASAGKINIGAGNGITVGTDSVSVDTSYIARRYVEYGITLTASVVYTITHGMGTQSIAPVAWEVSSGELLNIVFKNRTANTVDALSTVNTVVDVIIHI